MSSAVLPGSWINRKNRDGEPLEIVTPFWSNEITGTASVTATQLGADKSIVLCRAKSELVVGQDKED